MSGPGLPLPAESKRPKMKSGVSLKDMSHDALNERFNTLQALDSYSTQLFCLHREKLASYCAGPKEASDTLA